MATIDEIKQQAEAVKNATKVGENTALRVGGVLVDLCEWMKNLSGGGTSGGSGGSTTGTLYVGSTSNNLGFDGSKNMNLYFGDGLKVEKSDNQITVSATGGGTGGGIRIKRNGSTLKDSNGDVLSCTSINFKYGGNWNSTPILINSDNEISVDLSVVANNGNGGSSSTLYPFTIYNGSSDNDYITYDGSSAAYLKFKSGFSISKVGLGYEISASGSGGSSGTTSGKLRFYKDSSEESWNGESDFKIIFGSGLNVTWDSHSQITLSATGGSSGGSSGGSVSWENVTNKPSTFTPSRHTHSTNDISGLNSYVKGTKVSNATNADRLANARTIWGQSFDGTDNITGDLKMGSAGGGSIQLWMNGGNILDRTGNTLHIGYGLKESSDGEINLDAYVTRVYTDNLSRHYDFKSNVFDVNTNAIHFGSGASGGKISWDRANNAFKIEGNVYATGGITALGVNSSAITSNNLDFTFKSVTAKKITIQANDDEPFSIYPENDTENPLKFSHSNGYWNIYDYNNDQIYFQNNCYIDSDGWVFSPEFHCNENGSMSLDGSNFTLGDAGYDVNVKFYYGGKEYKLDMSKAISLGVFTAM